MKINRKTVAGMAITLGILTLFFWPTFRWLYDSWVAGGFLNRDNPYSHGFLIPLISAFIVWARRDQMEETKPAILGIFVLALGAALYLVSFNQDMRSLGALSLLIVLTGLVIAFLGIRTTRAMAFPLFFLLFMIPPPFIQDLTYDLQTISSDSSVWIAQKVGVDVTTQGNLIFLGDAADPSATLDVGPACSGINTLVAMVALAALCAFVLRGAMYKRVFLFALAFPLAIAANTLRLAAIVVRADSRGLDSAITLHDWSDPLFFGIAGLLLVLFALMFSLTLAYQKPPPINAKVILMRVWVLIMILANVAAAMFSLAGSTIDGGMLEHTAVWILGLLFALAVFNIACGIALLEWKRWGLYGLAAASVVVLIISLAIGEGIIGSLVSLLGVAVLYGLLHISSQESVQGSKFNVQ
ncbi:MAG: exosortase/archaeosortase family protein [Dehalococcoidia bacterium]|nr:exosortase/archaeosortase family protein [Dehalococcoidia bacterium]